MDNGNGLVKTYDVTDGNGHVIGTREAVTYAGLLNRAHQEGLKSIKTTLVQAPSEANGMTAISMAEVETEKGVFTDYGDANPENVDSIIVPHIIRMSVTRAKARALRDAINVGVVSLEELAMELTQGNGGKPPNGSSAPANGNRHAQRSQHRDSGKPMTEHQRKYLFQLLADKGFDIERAQEWLCGAFDIQSSKQITKKGASDMIDHLIKEASLPQETVN